MIDASLGHERAERYARTVSPLRVAARFGLALAASALVACAYDWASLDPRERSGTSGGTLGVGGSGGAASDGGEGGVGGVGGIGDGGAGGTDPCGNGSREGDEQCDDGNLEPGDGCDAACEVECDELLNDVTFHCYAPRAIERSEQEALAECEALGPGWTLGAIQDAAELTWLGAQPEVITLIAVSPFVWLGGGDAAREGNYAWYTPEPFPDGLWASGQPDNNGDEDCVDLWLLSSGVDIAINDDLCSRTLPFLCERRPAR